VITNLVGSGASHFGLLARSFSVRVLFMEGRRTPAFARDP
jgi:hypothetical protein